MLYVCYISYRDCLNLCYVEIGNKCLAQQSYSWEQAVPDTLSFLSCFRRLPFNRLSWLHPLPISSPWDYWHSRYFQRTQIFHCLSRGFIPSFEDWCEWMSLVSWEHKSIYMLENAFKGEDSTPKKQEHLDKYVDLEGDSNASKNKDGWILTLVDAA